MTQDRTTRMAENLAVFGQCWTRMERALAYDTPNTGPPVRAVEDKIAGRLCLHSTEVVGGVQEGRGSMNLNLGFTVSWIVAEESAWENLEDRR